MTHDARMTRNAKKPRGTGLRFVKVQDLGLVPRHLVDQVKPPISVERFYMMARAVEGNPLSILGVFADMQTRVVHGFLWAGVNPLDEFLDVHVLSVDQEYQRRGIVKETRDIMNKIRKRHGLAGVRFQTVTPEIFEGYARRSDLVIMEAIEQEEGDAEGEAEGKKGQRVKGVDGWAE